MQDTGVLTDLSWSFSVTITEKCLRGPLKVLERSLSCQALEGFSFGYKIYLGKLQNCQGAQDLIKKIKIQNQRIQL